MGDLEAFVAQQSETVKRIYEHHKALADQEQARGYLGASILGEECDRLLWYTFRGLAREEVDGRLHRLFETGDVEEGRFVRELRAIGCEVLEVDPETGEQIEVTYLGGHVSGHLDAAVLGVPEAPKTWHVGEFKTHKDKLFAKLEREGVQGSNPKHWVQMQVYMGLTGMTRALYLAKNKDTDHLYAERVRFDREAFNRLMERARRIVTSIHPPERVASRLDDFRCKFCPALASGLCWGTDADGWPAPAAVPIPEKTCRSCCHATPETELEGAAWSCARYQTSLDTTDVGAECPSHLLLPGLVGFATAEDSGADGEDDWIEFQNEDGTRWRHGSGPGHWTTEELLTTRGPLEGPKRLPTVEPPSELLEGGDLPLLERYPWQESERVWDGPVESLSNALANMVAPTEALQAIEPKDHQDDENVNAIEYTLDDEDYLVVLYKHEQHAAIWKGKA